MLRNKEFQWLLIMLGLMSFLFSGVGFFFSPLTGVMIMITSISFILCISLFTLWRYREIGKLTHYLREISSGNYSLDVRDNVEGELSILKNEIYKVTTILSEYSSHLERDKTTLKNAISDISHQLKTPLTSMMVMADLLEKPDLPSIKRIEFTNNLQTQLERLDWLVSSLLKLAKMDAGAIHFKKDSILVKQLLEKSLEAIVIPLDIKEINVKMEGAEDVSFIGDFNWTEEALINILKNCVEHTPKGGTLQMICSKNPLYTEIRVKDTGKGIPKEDLPYIFTRFYKGKYASKESVGIGLALADQIVTSQGGHIEVESEMGKGTQFIMKFYHK